MLLHMHDLRTSVHFNKPLNRLDSNILKLKLNVCWVVLRRGAVVEVPHAVAVGRVLWPVPREVNFRAK